MAQTSFNDGDTFGQARSAINGNATDAQSRLTLLESYTPGRYGTLGLLNVAALNGATTTVTAGNTLDIAIGTATDIVSFSIRLDIRNGSDEQSSYFLDYLNRDSGIALFRSVSDEEHTQCTFSCLADSGTLKLRITTTGSGTLTVLVGTIDVNVTVGS